MQITEEQINRLFPQIQSIAQRLDEVEGRVGQNVRRTTVNNNVTSALRPTLINAVDIINNEGVATTEYTWEPFNANAYIESGASFAIVSVWLSDNNANKTILLEGRDKASGTVVQIIKLEILDDPDTTACATQVLIPLSGGSFEHQLTVTGGASPTEVTDNFVFQLVGYL